MSVFLLLALVFVFFAYLVYTRQMQWFLGVARNTACGICGLLMFNFFFSGFGLAVGINAVTVLIVGVLGAPGFLLLYATQLLVR
ncbi:MAG: pro-sigmaK processing inhibitor BofA family protein [Defluviitaleaceae bacterium]|nr:pro-sigmaK processing inhibitor BofA family protein [Defluviitaleaceae bacterium]MCL2261840.1 pro-sigmaK processing inhibitor BofA family protein [Defluviitaleaceae bacterium]